MRHHLIIPAVQDANLLLLRGCSLDEVITELGQLLYLAMQRAIVLLKGQPM